MNDHKSIGFIFNPGDFDRRITILKPVDSRTSSGATETAFIQEKVVYAKRELKAHQEREDALQEKAITRASFIVRYNQEIKDAGIDATWRVRDDQGQDWFLEGLPEELGRKRFWRLKCTYYE